MLTKKKTKIFIVIALVIVLVFFRLGYWMVDMDKSIPKSDIIFILMGSYGERGLLAADLYHQGIASKIVLVQPFSDQDHLLAKNGVMINSDENIIASVLAQKGIDSSKVELVSGLAVNTISEAQRISNYCIKHPDIKRICVVTSTYHTGRARKIINDVLEKNELKVSITFPENKYTDYRYSRWYLRQRDIVTTVSETTKTIYYLCWAKWWLK